MQNWAEEIARAEKNKKINGDDVDINKLSLYELQNLDICKGKVEENV